MQLSHSFPAVCLVLLVFAQPAIRGDELLIEERDAQEKPFKSKASLTGILVLSDGSLYSYLTVEGDRIVWKSGHGESEYRRITIKRSDADERAALIAKWASRVFAAEVDRSTGGPVQLLSPTIRYPLPANVTYVGIGGGPATINGPEIYFGSDPKSAAKVSLSEIREIAPASPDAATVAWRDGRTTREQWLTAWKYDTRSGEPPVVAGYDPTTLDKKEFALSSLKSIRFQSPASVSCSQSPDHKFGSFPSSWRFCPICGAPLNQRNGKDAAPTVTDPVTQNEATKDKEAEAETKLKLAKTLLKTSKSSAQRRLREIVKDFEGTQAAKEAEDLLKSLGQSKK